MKRIKKFSRVIVIYIVLIVSFAACNSSSNIPDKEAEAVYYNINDFQSLIIGESTFKDVYNIAPDFTMYAVSYGALCEYLSDAGGKIYVRLYGKELIVGEIEECP